MQTYNGSLTGYEISKPIEVYLIPASFIPLLLHLVTIPSKVLWNAGVVVPVAIDSKCFSNVGISYLLLRSFLDYIESMFGYP